MNDSVSRVGVFAQNISRSKFYSQNLLDDHLENMEFNGEIIAFTMRNNTGG